MDFKLYDTLPEELEDEWNDLLAESFSHVPFLRHEYLRVWQKTRGGGEWAALQPVVVTARQAGKLVGVAPLFHTPDRLGAPALMLLGSVEVSDYLDLIARPADMGPFIENLLPFLSNASLPAWKSLDLCNILDSSPTLPALAAAAQKLGWGCTVERLQPSPYIQLPGDWETYLAGIDKKQRHEIRRKMRRLEEAEVPSRWYIVEDAATLDAEIEDFMGLMEQDDVKDTFLTPPMREHMHLSARCAFERGCLHLSFVEINGQKAAGKLCFDYLNRLWGYNSGVNRQFMEYSPGWVLTGNILRWANQNGREVFDFMRGNEEYKYRFGAVDRYVMRAVLTPTR